MKIWVALGIGLAAALVGCQDVAQRMGLASRSEDIVFADPRQQAAEFIAKYHSIELSMRQEEMKQEALSTIPAPCCASFSIATCCCPCNLAKAVWGLSHHLIAERGYDVPRVRETVQRWLRLTNEAGYRGDACYTGGCNRSFEHDGCGGMDENRIL